MLNTEAVKRLVTGFLKLLFPYVKTLDDINITNFKRYCLKPAIEMREIIFYQMGLVDFELKNQTMLILNTNEDFSKNGKKRMKLCFIWKREHDKKRKIFV